MCKSMEDMINQADLAARKRIVLNLLKSGKLSYEEIAEVTELPLEKIESLAGEKCMGLTDMKMGKISEPILNQF